MAYSKSFPTTEDKYPKWEEVFLTEHEELGVEKEQREANLTLLKECVDDARAIMQAESMKDFQTSMVDIALALFEKRASHVVYWKESKAKEKFDSRR